MSVFESISNVGATTCYRNKPVSKYGYGNGGCDKPTCHKQNMVHSSQNIGQGDCWHGTIMDLTVPPPWPLVIPFVTYFKLCYKIVHMFDESVSRRQVDTSEKRVWWKILMNKTIWIIKAFLWWKIFISFFLFSLIFPTVFIVVDITRLVTTVQKSLHTINLKSAYQLAAMVVVSVTTKQYDGI